MSLIQYDHDHDNEVTLFGQVNFRNQFRRFGIKTDDRRRHVYVIGKTGVGKTSMLENMMLSDILAGHGCCFVDPHGDTAEKLLDFIPSNRTNDVVYFNPADLDYPVGFNILETAREEQKHLVASGLMGVFKKIWPDVWSPRMEYILLNCVLALLDYPGATLMGLSRILSDKDYRKKVVAKIRNPIVKTFWVAEFESWSEKYATEAIAPVQNKVGQFLSASIIRNIVAQVKSTINPREIMDEGKILIVNLSKGKIGEDNMRLLGGMLITKIQLAAMERVDIKHEVDRRDFYLYVDEFQNFANESFAAILSEARKYRLNLIVAHQYIAQLEEETAKAIFGNVGTIVTMRVGAEDAQFMENEFMPVFIPEDLVNLPKYNAYIKLMVDGVATQPFSATTLPPIAKVTGSEERIIAISRERFAARKSVIEEKILKWSGMEISDQSNKSDAEDREFEGRIQELLQKQIIKARNPVREVQIETDDELDEKETEEYLRISPDRMESIRSSMSNPPKKQKPMFKHTCTRCGKTWEMPIQLDPTRPMYCTECMPLIKEEQKAGKKRPPIRDNQEKDKPNKPHFIGEIKNLPKGPTIQDRFMKEPEELSLIEEIQKERGQKIETRKEKLGGTDDRERAERSRRNRNRHQNNSGAGQANSNNSSGTNASSYDTKDSYEKIESRRQEKSSPTRTDKPSPTVFRTKTSSVHPSILGNSKKVEPGERVQF